MLKFDDSELTESQKRRSIFVTGAVVFALGAFLLLSGADVLPLDFKKLLLPACLAAAAVVFFVAAFIQNNPLLLWLSVALFFPALVSAAAAFSPLGYDDLFPVYFLTPALCSLVTMLYTKEYAFHSKIIVIFTLAFSCALLSLFADWQIVLSATLMVTAAGIIALAFIKRKKDD